MEAPEQATWTKVTAECLSRRSMRRAACAGPARLVRWHCLFCHLGDQNVPDSSVSGLPSGVMVSSRVSTEIPATLMSTVALNDPSLVTGTVCLQFVPLTVFDSGPDSVTVKLGFSAERSVTAGDAQLSNVSWYVGDWMN